MDGLAESGRTGDAMKLKPTWYGFYKKGVPECKNTAWAHLFIFIQYAL